MRELVGLGCLTRMHVVRLLAPPLDGEDHTKDIDFSPAGIRSAGTPAMRHEPSARARPWIGEFDPLEGLVLHEHMDEDADGGGVGPRPLSSNCHRPCGLSVVVRF